MRKSLSILLAVVLFVGYVVTVIAAENTARTISIFKVEGDVEMTKGTAKKFTAKEGMKLADGYTVSTGVKAYAWLRLDEETLIKLDQRSKISVSKASANKLSVSVLSGTIAVDAATQKDGDVLEIRAGNSALAVRGTSFTVECQIDGKQKFIMITGSGTVDGAVLEAGRVLTISDSEDGEGKTYDMSQLTVDSDLSPFVIDALLEHKDELLADNILTQEILDTIEDIKAEAEKKQQQQENTLTGANVDEEGNPIAPKAPIPQGPSSGPTHCVSVTYTNAASDSVTASFTNLYDAIAYVNSVPDPISSGIASINVYGNCDVTDITIGSNLSSTFSVVNFDINARLLVRGTMTVLNNAHININSNGVLAGVIGAKLDLTGANTGNITNNSANVYFLENGVYVTGVPTQTQVYVYQLYNNKDGWDYTIAPSPTIT